MAHEAAINQRVHSRCLAGELGIHHLRRDAVLARVGFDDQRREFLGAVGMAAQLSDADRAAVADDGARQIMPIGNMNPAREPQTAVLQ